MRLQSSAGWTGGLAAQLAVLLGSLACGRCTAADAAAAIVEKGRSSAAAPASCGIRRICCVALPPAPQLRLCLGEHRSGSSSTPPPAICGPVAQAAPPRGPDDFAPVVEIVLAADGPAPALTQLFARPPAPDPASSGCGGRLTPTVVPSAPVRSGIARLPPCNLRQPLGDDQGPRPSPCCSCSFRLNCV